MLKKLKETDLPILHTLIYSSEKPRWTLYNAPYFDEYKQINLETFLQSENHLFFLSENVLAIVYEERIIGVVTRYWEDIRTRWLEIGIVIYDDSLWSHGIGTSALQEWIGICFKDFPEIERVGLTTWSGNPGMMRLSEKLGMTQEARIRKVRYYKGTYYDSIKYGILRDEFFALK